MRQLIRHLSAWLGMSLGLAMPAWCQETTLVQSIPAETSLAQPDLPYAQDIWARMIASAKSSIDLGQFYLSNAPGSPLEPIIQELEKAGARGIKIRTLVDKSMAANDPATYDRFRAIKNSQLQLLDLKKLTGGIIHAKYLIVDREQVFVGSQNFDWRALTQIHETGALVRNADIAANLTEIFEIDWQISQSGTAPTPVRPKPIQPAAVELVASPPQFNPANIRWSLTALKALIQGARTSIQVQVMDYSTSGKSGSWKQIDGSLRAAAKRGVAVELLVSDWSASKPAIDQLKKLQKVKGITVKIVVIPPFSGGCIPFSRTMHTKLMVVDGETLWVGTSNWSQGYFTATRGVELIFHNAALAEQGSRIFETLWTSQYASVLDIGGTYTPPVKDCLTARQ